MAKTAVHFNSDVACQLRWHFIISPVTLITHLNYGQFYSHAYVDVRETWTRENQPNAF